MKKFRLDLICIQDFITKLPSGVANCVTTMFDWLLCGPCRRGLRRLCGCAKKETKKAATTVSHAAHDTHDRVVSAKKEIIKQVQRDLGQAAQAFDDRIKSVGDELGSTTRSLSRRVGQVESGLQKVGSHAVGAVEKEVDNLESSLDRVYLMSD